jgi:hypothetical protein
MIRRRFRSVILMLMGLAVAYVASEVSPSVAGAQEKQASDCKSIKRQGEWPEFTSSGAWSVDGKQLFLLDHARRRLLEFSSAGKSEGVVHGELAKRLALGHPRKIDSLEGGGFYVQTDDNRFTVTEPEGKGIKDVVAAPSPSNEIISKVFNFAAVGDEVLAFVDVKELSARKPGKASWQQGFVVFPLGQPNAFRWLEKSISFEERNFYRLSFPFVASLGSDTAYVLRMETRPELYRYKKGSDKLELVDAFKSYTTSHLLPELPPFRQSTDIEQLMRVVERSHQMPVGLYAGSGGRRLFLLERSWTGTKTDWSFVAIEPEDPGTELRRVAIGIDAEHLFAVPGGRQWSLVSKAHPTDILSQEVTGIRLFSSAKLEGPKLPARLCN